MSHTKVVKINLLPGASRLQVKALRFTRHNKAATYAILGIWIASTIFGFVYNFVVEKQLADTKSRLEKAKSEYTKYSKVVLATGRVRNAAKQVAEVLEGRFEYATAFENFNKLSSSAGVDIEDFELKGRRAFRVSGFKKDFSGASIVERLVKDLNAKKYEGFDGAKLESISWEPSRGWNFEMEVSL